MRVLFIGDIVGKPGRRAVAALLPKLRQELNIDFVIANLENLAHGKGLTKSTLQEVIAAGIDAGTGGNHTFSKPEAAELYATEPNILIRPMNMAGDVPGRGEKTFTVGQKRVVVLNLQGEFGMKEVPVESPFITAQHWIQNITAADAVIVDVHAEVTSEKINLGWYLDGKVAAVIGTHTHVPTADVRVLPKGTGYITDVGMVGLKDSSLGVDKDATIQKFLTDQPITFEIPDHGIVAFNAVLMDVDKNKCNKIEFIYREVNV